MQAPKSYQNPSSYKPFFNLPKEKEGFRACMQPKEEIGEPIKEKREEAYLSMKEGAEIQDTKPSLEALIDGENGENERRRRRKMREGGERAGATRDRPLYWMGFGKVQVLPLK